MNPSYPLSEVCVKQEQRCPATSNPIASDSAEALREENERLRADVAYLKKS